ncbi:uncharacterized protein LOC143851814 [Tasmannia lanceolata]|uniref:uncharacterized protein LOC143851814 n=1 Tax=Tasmannia lanceolata TaxID=3420 RepID=UPI004062C266
MSILQNKSFWYRGPFPSMPKKLRSCGRVVRYEVLVMIQLERVLAKQHYGMGDIGKENVGTSQASLIYGGLLPRMVVLVGNLIKMEPLLGHRVSLVREGNLMKVPVLLPDSALRYLIPKSSPELPLRKGNELLLMVEGLKAKICELLLEGERTKAERDTSVALLAEVEVRAKAVEDEARDLREAASQRDETITLQELHIRELRLQLHDEDYNVGGEESDSEATISAGDDRLDLEVPDLGYGDTQA